MPNKLIVAKLFGGPFRECSEHMELGSGFKSPRGLLVNHLLPLLNSSGPSTLQSKEEK